MKLFVLRIALVLSIGLPLLTIPAQATPYFVQCYDFGCKTTRELRFETSQWDQISAIFASVLLIVPPKNGRLDRWSPWWNVSAVNSPTPVTTRAGTILDPISPGGWIVSTNTYQHLSALQEFDLMKWHRVDLKQRRTVRLATHWTATIRETDRDERFAVDSWYRDNGEMPYIQPIADWAKKSDFPGAFNPQLGAN